MSIDCINAGSWPNALNCCPEAEWVSVVLARATGWAHEHGFVYLFFCFLPSPRLYLICIPKATYNKLYLRGRRCG